MAASMWNLKRCTGVAQGSLLLLACCVVATSAASNSSFDAAFSMYLNDDNVLAAVQSASQQYELGADHNLR